MTSLKIVIATGIYPPAIGGPATYARELAERLRAGGATVDILTYGAQSSGNNVTFVSQSGGPLLRWWRFAQALKRQAADADIVYILSSVSCGVPLWLSKLTKPKRVLRLGGDFFWERYTDRGGRKDLRTWYASSSVWRRVMKWLLQQFDAIIFSTQFQYDIYREHYSLPQVVVIENALPRAEGHLPHTPHSPLRLLVMSRLVRFKNVPSLIEAVRDLPEVILTIVGDGPVKNELLKMVEKEDLSGKVVFVETLHGSDKQKVFNEHDLLVIPSLTDISPNAALEARAAGLPVLLTEQTGLSATLTQGMTLADLSTPEKIQKAIESIRAQYPVLHASDIPQRSWDTVSEEHAHLFTRLTQ